IPLAVVDHDRTRESRALTESFVAADLFDLEARLDRAEDVDTLFRRNEVAAALVIPRGYSRKLARGEDTQVQLIVDGSDGNSAAVSMGYAQAISSSTAEPPMVNGQEVKPPVQMELRALFNPGLRSAIFIVPGLIALIPALIAVIMTALTVAREFERGSMEQLFATPLGRVEIVLG